MTTEDKIAAVAERVRQVPPEHRAEALVELLGSNTAAEVEFATRMFTGIGEVATPTLIQAAMQHRRRPRLCARLLDLVGDIGAQLEIDDWMWLPMLGRHKNPIVRAAAARLMFRLQQLRHAATMRNTEVHAS